MGAIEDGQMELEDNNVSKAAIDNAERLLVQQTPCTESRSASANGGARIPSPRRNSTTSKNALLPPASWPEPDYQPEALPSPREGSGPEQNAASSGLEGGRLDGDDQESPAQAICRQKLALVFEERPEVRERLMDLLADSRSQDNEVLKLQVTHTVSQWIVGCCMLSLHS